MAVKGKVRGKALEKAPSRAEVMFNQYKRVESALEGVSQVVDKNKDEFDATVTDINNKMNLQGLALIGILQIVKDKLEVLEEPLEGSIRMWEDVYFAKDKLYVGKFKSSGGEGGDDTPNTDKGES